MTLILYVQLLIQWSGDRRISRIVICEKDSDDSGSFYYICKEYKKCEMVLGDYLSIYFSNI